MGDCTRGWGDALIAAAGPLASEVRDWRRLLSEEEDEQAVAALRSRLRTGASAGRLEASWRAWRIALAAHSTHASPVRRSATNANGDKYCLPGTEA